MHSFRISFQSRVVFQSGVKLSIQLTDFSCYIIIHTKPLPDVVFENSVDRDQLACEAS